MSPSPISLGVIIPNRDRALPLHACLASLAVQDLPPAWVVLSDLSSQQPHRAALAGLADRYGVSYLRIDHHGAWNKSLAFNTAFRLAMGSLPAVTHVIQLDANMLLHPHMLTAAAAALRVPSSTSSSASAAFYCAPRMAPPELTAWTVPGDLADYERMLAQCGPATSWSVGGFMALPCDWLARGHGFDETFTGWGHEDTELWLRVKGSLPYSGDVSGTLLIHQWHELQPGAGQRGANWMSLVQRMANPGHVANPAAWGAGRVTESVLRSGLTGTRFPEGGESPELTGGPNF